MSRLALRLSWASGLILLFVAFTVCSPPPPPISETPIPPISQESPPAQIPVTTTVTQPPQLSKIAFVRDCGPNYGFEIFTADSDGSNVVNITNRGSRDVWPTWSPDGTKIAFESVREWHGWHSIYVMEANGENVECLTPEVTDCEFPSWSPDGKKIAYCSSKLSGSSHEFVTLDTFVMNADGSGKKPVAPISRGWTATSYTSQVCPSWFLDSQRIAFASNITGVWQIYSVNIDGTDKREHNVCIETICGMRLPSGTAPTVAVSPDGNSIAFDYLDKFGRYDVYLLSLDNGDTRNLTRGCLGNSSNPSWSPDGTKIAFTSQADDDYNISIIDISGGDITTLVKDGAFPVWQR